MYNAIIVFNSLHNFTPVYPPICFVITILIIVEETHLTNIYYQSLEKITWSAGAALCNSWTMHSTLECFEKAHCCSSGSRMTNFLACVNVFLK